MDSETGQIIVKGIVKVDANLSATKVEKDKTRLRHRNERDVQKSQFVISR